MLGGCLATSDASNRALESSHRVRKEEPSAQPHIYQAVRDFACVLALTEHIENFLLHFPKAQRDVFNHLFYLTNSHKLKDIQYTMIHNGEHAILHN